LRAIARSATFALASIIAVAPSAAQAPRTAPPIGAPPPEYRIDAGHSRVEFSIPFMYLPVRGRFNDVRGTVLYDPAAPERSSVSAVVDARSIDTGSRHRDEHLRSADFFDAERFPTLVFQSRRVRREGRALAMTGPLTMHGVTRDVTIRFRPLAPPAADPHGSNIVTFTGSVRLSRRDFGIAGGGRFNPWFDAVRAATMGDSVDVGLEVSGWVSDWRRKQDAEVDSSVARIAREGVAAATARVHPRRRVEHRAGGAGAAGARPGRRRAGDPEAERRTVPPLVGRTRQRGRRARAARGTHAGPCVGAPGARPGPYGHARDGTGETAGTVGGEPSPPMSRDVCRRLFRRRGDVNSNQ
jgi:polyisoprenoid-binding protein YceI